MKASEVIKTIVRKETTMPDTVFMIHGMWCGPHDWNNYKNFFQKKQYKCFTTTLRFHDMDPKDKPDPELGTVSLLDYAEDLEREIAQLDVKPIIIGHSMGGLLAQILGTRGLAKALILLSPASPAGIFALRPSTIKTFWSVLTKWNFWKNPMRITFDEARYSVFNLLPEEEHRPTYDKFVYESGQASTEIGFWMFDKNKATRIDETKITCPVLIIGGAKDRVTPVSVTRQIARKYKATYKEFANHAHWLVAEPGWQEIADYIHKWLQKAKEIPTL